MGAGVAATPRQHERRALAMLTSVSQGPSQHSLTRGFDIGRCRVYNVPMHVLAALVAALIVACLLARSDTALLAEPAVVQAIQIQPATPPIRPRASSTSARWIRTSGRTTAGVCRRCGMKLVAGVPDPVEFHLDMRVHAGSRRSPQRPAVLPVLRARSLEGPSRHDLQRRPRKVLPRVRRQRGSAVLRARASDGSPRTACSSTRSRFRRPGMYRVLERLLSDRRDAAADDRDGLRAGTRLRIPCGSSRDYSAKADRNMHVSMLDDSRTADRRQPHADPLHAG